MNAKDSFITPTGTLADPRVDPTRVIRAPRGASAPARAGSPKRHTG